MHYKLLQSAVTFQWKQFFLVFGLKTALILRNLIYSLSSLKGSVFKPCTMNIALMADM